MAGGVLEGRSSGYRDRELLLSQFIHVASDSPMAVLTPSVFPLEGVGCFLPVLEIPHMIG